MNKKYVLKYLLFTFVFSYLLWGIVKILTGIIGFKISDPLCMGLYLLGSFGPMFGSYLVQKQEHMVAGFRDYIKKAFRFKSAVSSYLLIIVFLLLYFVYPFAAGKITMGIPLYTAVLLIPVMLFGGGMEEVGWRWILQPELEKKFPFSLAAVFTSAIWALWHVPLFFIEGSSQAQVNFISFFILLVGMSFAQAFLFEYSKNIWLSILLHCCYNAFQMSLVVEEKIIPSFFMTLIMVGGTLLLRYVYQKRQHISHEQRKDRPLKAGGS